MPGKRSSFQWRPPRVRHEPPTLTEALAAARDLSDDPEAQAAIAAGLMGIPAEEVRRKAGAELGRRPTDHPGTDRARPTATAPRRSPVVVERRVSRSAGIRRP